MAIARAIESEKYIKHQGNRVGKVAVPAVLTLILTDSTILEAKPATFPIRLDLTLTGSKIPKTETVMCPTHFKPMLANLTIRL